MSRSMSMGARLNIHAVRHRLRRVSYFPDDSPAKEGFASLKGVNSIAPWYRWLDVCSEGKMGSTDALTGTTNASLADGKV